MDDPQTGRLLVVDDNEMNRDMLSRRLQRKGHEVVTADDGAAALELVEGEQFDVVLLDIMMPGIDGFEVLERLRATYTPTELPIIMATAKGERGDIVRAFKLGANDYVTKPLDFPVVSARVQTQLSLKRSVDRIVALEQDLARRNAALEKANRRMSKDLAAAAKVQRSMLPTSLPNRDGLEFAWFFRPCDELAGDILSVFQINDTHVGLYLLDVSGHGVQAALLSVTLSRVLTPVADQPNLVRRLVGDGPSLAATPPGEVVAELNRRFPVNPETGQYFTIHYAVLNTQTHELRSVCAGHPGPVYLPAEGEPVIMTSRSFPVGWVPEAAYEEKCVQLQPGDRLYLYSDGINEAMNAEREQFGEARIIEAGRTCRGMSLQESLDELAAAAEGWSERGFEDDATLMAIERSRAS
jgi:sigma-B regulation protein RsbU (phosphoserine phosphatase)